MASPATIEQQTAAAPQKNPIITITTHQNSKPKPKPPKHTHTSTCNRRILLTTSHTRILEFNLETPSVHRHFTLIPLKYHSLWRRKAAINSLPVLGYFPTAEDGFEVFDREVKDEKAGKEGETWEKMAQEGVYSQSFFTKSGVLVRILEFRKGVADLKTFPQTWGEHLRVQCSKPVVGFVDDGKYLKGPCHGLRVLKWKAGFVVEKLKKWWEENPRQLWNRFGPMLP